MSGIMNKDSDLYVTLTASDNEYISYPTTGLLTLLELGTNGSIITAVFRHLEPGDKRPGAPVSVRRPQFTYNGGGPPRLWS